MLEIIVALSAGVGLGIFYWRRAPKDYWTAVLLCLWCWVGPDVPKLFWSGRVVNFGTYFFMVALVLLALLSFSLKKRKQLIVLLFVEAGLLIHLLIDYLFKYI